MRIFDKSLFASDADWFLSQSKEVQRQWILDNTNQKDDSLIDSLLSTIKNSDHCDCGCGNCGKSKQDGNISSTISEAVATDTQPTNNEVVSKRNSTKRPTKAKRGED